MKNNLEKAEVKPTSGSSESPRPAQERNSLRDLDAAATVSDIERVFISAVRKKNYITRTHKERNEIEELRRRCNERAVEIAPRLRRGYLLATRRDKGKGNSRKYTVNGQRFSTGTWGNGAGYRWAMADFERWYERLLREGGLRSKRKIGSIIDWTRSGYLWRALRYLQ